MNTRQVYLVSVLVIGMGVSLAQANVLQSDAATAYQSSAPLPTTTMQIDPPYNLPVSALSVATPPTSDPFDISISQAVTSVLADGSAAATYSRVSGFNGGFGPPDGLAATATSVSSIEWTIASASLAPGTPVVVAAFISFQGTIGAANMLAQGPGVAVAEVSATLSVDSNPIFAGLATVDAVDVGTGLPVLDAQGAWAGDFVAAPIDSGGLGVVGGYALATVDQANFVAQIGVPFTMDFVVHSGAAAAGATNVFAEVNFLDPAAYHLGVFDPQTLQPIGDAALITTPEPATALLAGLALLVPVLSGRAGKHERTTEAGVTRSNGASYQS